MKTTRTRTKAQPVLIIDNLEFTDCINQAALLKQQKLALNGKINQFEAELKAEIKELDKQDKLLTARCEKYASAHRNTLLPRGKSTTTALAKWGYRAIQKSVKSLAGYTDSTALGLMQQSKGFEDYIKCKLSISKDSILAAHNSKKLSDEQLKTVGLGIAGGKGEAFFIDILGDNEELDQDCLDAAEAQS